MEIFKRIFGTSDIMKQGVDMIDNSFYTKQEKAQSHKDFLKLYIPYKLAQRVLAFSVIGVFLFSFLTIFIMIILNLDVTTLIKTVNSFGLPYLTGMVMTYYFAGSVLHGGK
jgi:hypothetical protein